MEGTAMMNNAHGTYTWSFTEFVFTRTGDAETDGRAKHFMERTQKLCEDLRSSYAEFLEVIRHGLLSVGEEEQDDILELLRDDAVHYQHTQTKNGEKLTLFVETERVEQVLGEIFSVSEEEAAANGIHISGDGGIFELTPEMELMMHSEEKLLLSSMLDGYFHSLGIYEQALAAQEDAESLAADCGNAQCLAYLVLEKEIGSAVTMRHLDVSDGFTRFLGSESERETSTGAQEREIDKSYFADEPEKSWYSNLSGICLQPITNYDAAGLTAEEYRKIAAEHMGTELAAQLLEMAESGESFEAYAGFDLCGTAQQILFMVDSISAQLRFNLDLIERCEMKPEDVPLSNLPHVIVQIEDGSLQRVPCTSLFIFSEDFELVEIPIEADGSDTGMILTQY